MKVQRLILITILLAGPMNFLRIARAEPWQQALTSRISTEFDTNPAMSPTYPGGVWRALFEPSYTVFGNIGADDLKAGLALQVARSTNTALSQNRDGPSMFLDWLRHSETGEYGLSAKYEEVSTREAGIDATGMLPYDSTRATGTMSGKWNKALSERSTLSAEGSHEDNSYHKGAYVDYSADSGVLKFSYAHSERSSSFLSISGDKYVPTGGGQTTGHGNAMLGWNWKVEDWDWAMQAGRYKMRNAIGTLAGASALYTRQRTQFVLNANREVRPSGLGGFVKFDRVSGSASYAWSERSDIGFDSEWQKNRSVTINNLNFREGIWFQYNLSPSRLVRTYYQHRLMTGGGGFSASGNMLGVSLSDNYSGF